MLNIFGILRFLKIVISKKHCWDFWKFSRFPFRFFLILLLLGFSNFEILKMLGGFFLHDEKIFFIQIFLNDLDYASRVPENYLEHSTASSEEDIDRVWEAFSWFSAQKTPFSSPSHQILDFGGVTLSQTVSY